MKKITIQKKQYTLPQKWNELTRSQLSFVATLTAKPLQRNSITILLLAKLMNADVKLLIHAKPEAIAELADIIQYIFNPSALTINPLPKIHQLCGPADGLQNCTLEEFLLYTETYYQQHTMGDDTAIRNLIATLWRPTHSGIRQPFNPDNIESRAEKIKIKPAEIRIITLFYEGCRNLIIHKFPKLFRAENGKKEDMGFLKLIENLNNGTLANNKQVKEANLYEALLRLHNAIVEQEKLKQQKGAK